MIQEQSKYILRSLWTSSSALKIAKYIGSNVISTCKLHVALVKKKTLLVF